MVAESAAQILQEAIEDDLPECSSPERRLRLMAAIKDDMLGGGSLEGRLQQARQAHEAMFGNSRGIAAKLPPPPSWLDTGISFQEGAKERQIFAGDAAATLLRQMAPQSPKGYPAPWRCMMGTPRLPFGCQGGEVALTPAAAPPLSYGAVRRSESMPVLPNAASFLVPTMTPVTLTPRTDFRSECIASRAAVMSCRMLAEAGRLAAERSAAEATRQAELRVHDRRCTECEQRRHEVRRTQDSDEVLRMENARLQDELNLLRVEMNLLRERPRALEEELNLLKNRPRALDEELNLLRERPRALEEELRLVRDRLVTAEIRAEGQVSDHDSFLLHARSEHDETLRRLRAEHDAALMQATEGRRFLQAELDSSKRERDLLLSRMPAEGALESLTRDRDLLLSRIPEEGELEAARAEILGHKRDREALISQLNAANAASLEASEEAALAKLAAANAAADADSARHALSGGRDAEESALQNAFRDKAAADEKAQMSEMAMQDLKAQLEAARTESAMQASVQARAADANAQKLEKVAQDLKAQLEAEQQFMITQKEEFMQRLLSASAKEDSSRLELQETIATLRLSAAEDQATLMMAAQARNEELEQSRAKLSALEAEHQFTITQKEEIMQRQLSASAKEGSSRHIVLEETIAALRQSAAEDQATVMFRSEELEQSRAKLSTLEAEHQFTITQKEEFMQRRLSASAKEDSSRHIVLQQTIATLRQSAAEDQATVRFRDEELEQSKAKLSAVEAAHQLAMTQTEEFMQIQLSAGAKEDSSRLELQALRSKLEEAEGKKNQFSDDITHLKEALSRREEGISNLRNSGAEREQEISRLRQELENKLGEADMTLQAEILRFQEELQRANMKRRNSSHEVVAQEQLQKDLKALTVERDGLRSDMAHFKKAASEQELRASSLRESLEEEMNNTQLLNQQLHDMKVASQNIHTSAGDGVKVAPQSISRRSSSGSSLSFANKASSSIHEKQRRVTIQSTIDQMDDEQDGIQSSIQASPQEYTRSEWSSAGGQARSRAGSLASEQLHYAADGNRSLASESLDGSMRDRVRSSVSDSLAGSVIRDSIRSDRSETFLEVDLTDVADLEIPKPSQSRKASRVSVDLTGDINMPAEQAWEDQAWEDEAWGDQSQSGGEWWKDTPADEERSSLVDRSSVGRRDSRDSGGMPGLPSGGGFSESRDSGGGFAEKYGLGPPGSGFAERRDSGGGGFAEKYGPGPLGSGFAERRDSGMPMPGAPGGGFAERRDSGMIGQPGGGFAERRDSGMPRPPSGGFMERRDSGMPGPPGGGFGAGSY